MLKLLGNNFVLAGVVALILVIIVFIERKRSDKKNNTKSIKDWVFWGKLFAAGYVLVLLVLFMKDRCPISGASGANCEGKSCSMFGSLKSKFYKPLSGGAAAAPTIAAPVKQAVVPRVAVPAAAAVAPQSSGSDLRVIDLNNVNIGDPDF
jgi:hypothetical protein